MKNENQFNAWLSGELRTLHSRGYHHVKISDKFTAGVSDFMIWGQRGHCVLESKYLQRYPNEGCKLLEHTYTGPQLTFMESIGLTGNRALGLLAVGDKKDGLLFVMDWDHIPQEGNWEVTEFANKQKKMRYTWDEWRKMVDWCLTGRDEYRGW